MSTLLPPSSRRLAYLRQLATHDWGTPTGFGGRTCFQAMPALELERHGEAPGHFRWEWIDYSLELLRARKDCQDFAMAGLVPMLYRYPDSAVLTPAHRESMATCLLAAKFWASEPGDDSCCWTTENHQVLYHSAELLMGQRYPDTPFGNDGKIGRVHREHARDHLYQWLEWRLRFGFSEWNSSCYYDEDAAALVNLCAYAEDPRLRRLAQAVWELLLLHLALNSLHGIPGGSQGRAYLAEAVAPATTPMAALAQLLWGADETVPTRFALTTILLAASDVSVPAAVIAVGRDCPDELENRERHSLDAETAADYGVYPDRQRDYYFFCGAQLTSHPLVSESRYIHFNGQEKWPGFFADYDYYTRCRIEGMAYDPHGQPHALSQADLYSYRTPDYLLGCAQDYRAGRPGYQQFIWCATLGERAVVFTTNPAPAEIPYGRPGPWIGNGILPKAVQHRNVLFCLYRVQPYPIYDQPPWWREERVHAYFPQQYFDEVVEREGWCFGRKGESYLALKALKPATWSPPAGTSPLLPGEAPYEWVVEDTECAWVCELGAARTSGSFLDFLSAIAAAPLAGDTAHLTYTSPSCGCLEVGWTQPLVVNGAPVAIHDYPRMANPYCTTPFGEAAYAIQCGEHRHVIDGRLLTS
jgi:hypothetical protein